MTKPLIGFIGQGFIGKNYADDFERRGYKTVRYSLEEPYKANKDKLKDCDFVFIAVPTPTSPDGFDFSIVRSAVGLVGKGKTAVIKSTIVPGTTKELQREFPDRIVIYSPEFLSEATAAHDAAHPFSNIIGLTEDTSEHKKAAEELHKALPEAPYDLTCSSTEAEIIKYTHNGSGYTQIVFFNLMYELASHHGCNWNMIQQALEADPLISNRYARPIHKSGRGAGGHCFIKDVAALRDEYGKKLDDKRGAAFFEAMERKNIELLRGTGKDLDLLESVYGAGILEEPVRVIPVPRLRSIRGEINLLVCTEAIDRNDPLLGFFHDWVQEFARHAHRVHVICLGYGARNLPANVMEHSLGKEVIRSSGTGVFRVLKRLRYSARFLGNAWRLRKQYDTVLVHLSPEYILLAGFLWHLLGKRIGFWYNDKEASLLVRFAIKLSDVVFYSSRDSFVAKSPNARLIPMGVDTDIYVTHERKAASNSLLFLGRITPKKKLDTILAGFAQVRERVKDAVFDVYGEARPGEEKYASEVRSRFAELERGGAISYRGSVLHDKTPHVYGSHDIFIHVGSMRGFNKTLYEAMAAGCLVISGEPELRELLHPKLFVEKPTPESIAVAIQAARSLTEEERSRERSILRAYVQREHSLSSVVPAMLEMLIRAGGEQSSRV